MMRLARWLPLGASIAVVSLSAALVSAAEAPWVRISVDPSRTIEIGWADGSYDASQATFESPERATLVLSNRSTASQVPAALTISSSDPSRFEMVTLTAVTDRTTHMTSVMHPTGSDAVTFDPGFALAGNESVAVTVEATPAGD